MKKLLIPLFCILFFEATAQQVADTIKKDLLTAPDTVKKLHSKPWSLVIPFAAIGYGALSFTVNPIRRVDYFVHGETNKTSPQFKSTAESYFQFAPVIIVYSLNLVGVTGKNTFIDRTALLTLSGGLLSVSEYLTKHVTHRLRPNGADYLSFPSGHTGIAFMGAEFLAQEFSQRSHLYTVVGYSFAVTTGVFRMYNRDHWFSDVVAGAGFGVLSTKLSYLIYPYIRNKLTHTDKQGKNTLIMPMYQDGVAGLTFTKEL